MPNSWDLSKIYLSEKDYEKDVDYLTSSLTPRLADYEGKLKDEASLKEFLGLERELNSLLNKIFIYVSSLSDLDKKNVHNATLLSKASLAAEDLGRKTSFEEPEIIAIGKEKIEKFLKDNKEFDDFSYQFEKLFLQASHVLSPEKEKLLSYFSSLKEEGGSLYSSLTVADYSPKMAKLSDGTEVEVNMSNWTSLIEKSPKTEDRKAIFDSLYSYYDAHKNTYAEIYNTTLQGELSTMRSRGYSSVLESHLEPNHIPTSVFFSLVEAAHDGASYLHKYIELRKKALGLSAHRSYDRFLELAHSDKEYSYDGAKKIFFASLSSFPLSFQDKAHEVLKEGYVDVFPKAGKRTGAYSTGGADIHPYILFNYQGRLDDIFTVAHESGHSIHTLYAEESQPTLKQDYTIFVAEIASTFNEHNLLDYLLTKGTLSKNERIALLQKAIDEIVSTFYRQTLFGEYEYDISLLAEKGMPINYEVLSNEMVKLYKEYYGIDIKEEVYKPLVWAYIPHLFYTPFYVYQYATSFSASMELYKRVKNKEEGAFEKYIGLLKEGGSDFPIEEVKRAGVDLTKKEAFVAVTDRMKYLVDELEKALSL